MDKLFPVVFPRKSHVVGTIPIAYPACYSFFTLPDIRSLLLLQLREMLLLTLLRLKATIIMFGLCYGRLEKR